MFGIIQAIVSLGIVANDKLDKMTSSSNSRSKAIANGNKYYNDGYGVCRDVRTGKKVSLYSGYGTYTKCSSYDFTIPYYNKKGLVTPKKIIYGVISKDYIRIQNIDYDIQQYKTKKISLSRLGLSYSAWKPTLSDLKYFEELFDSEEKATNYCKNKYNNKKHDYSHYVKVFKLYIVPLDDYDYYKFRSFTEMRNDKKDENIIRRMERKIIDGKEWLVGDYEINQAKKSEERIQRYIKGGKKWN